MVYYDKKVIYLAEMEYGNKIKGAGFVRMECRDESCSFDMHVSGMKTLAEKKYDIYAISAEGKEYLAGRIFLRNGSGEWKEVYDRERVGIAWQEMAEIQVKISDTKVLSGKMPFQAKAVQAAEIKVRNMGGNTEEKVRDAGENGGIWKFVREGIGQANGDEKGNMQQNPGNKKKEQDEPEKGNSIFQIIKGEGGWGNRYRMDEKELKRRDEEMERDKGSKADAAGRRKEIGKEPVNTESGNQWERQKKSGEKEKERIEGEEGKVQIEDVILNDKWEQLKQIYSVVHPYEDERQYIAIQPKDFVIMTGDYQHLANNSFLLHGFYNYRHIVLGREQDGNFYLGVPGVYYEREKMVALMFGFEAFECDGGKAEAGKFGYYLRKVKI